MTINPLVAARVDAPASPWAGVWIAEDIELVAQGVRSRSWVDATLGAVGGGLDGLALVSDPVGALLQYGISWLIEHVRPLSEALDWLAGDPAQIAAHARTWRNVAASLRTESDDLARAARTDVTEWQGAAADAYQRWAAQRDQSLQALARASDTMALITEGAGMVIGTVRMMVRDAVATVVSRLIVYAGEVIATAGLATPLVAEQVSTLCASWAAKIARWLRGLIASIRNLLREAARLGDLIKTLRTRLRTAPHGRSTRDGSSGRTSAQTRSASAFDPGKHKGALGEEFRPGVSDPHGMFEAKERAVADRLADEGEMVHPRERIDDVDRLKNPDAMVRMGPADPGTVTEFKTLRSDSTAAVKENVLRAGNQLAQHGGGDVVIDGRGVALTDESARRGFARAVGQARAHGSDLPDRVRIILGDGTIILLP